MPELLSLLLLLRAVVGGALLLGAAYHDTAAVLARLGQLEAEHPALATTYSIGRSVQAWNNGKEVPKWCFTEIQKMSSSTTGRCKYT